jgi:hypothetical protein
MHKSITSERVCDAIEESMCGLSNPGFCLSCGADHDECEPDAEGYECYECGEHKVMGAENVLMMVA